MTIEVIVKYNGNIGELAQKLNYTVEILSSNYAIMNLTIEQIVDILKYPQIEYIEPSTRLALFDYSPSMQSSCIISTQRQTGAYGLTGKGTIVAILDSGIDYSHPDFINDDGTTRILNIWDQDIVGKPPQGFNTGSEYNSTEINLALNSPIEQKNYIVPHTDFNGHGTAVAGVAAGNGRASKSGYVGAAPEAQLIIVKLAKNPTEYFTSTTNIMRGIKYVIDKAIQYNMPVCINISYGNNQGLHDGSSLFEQYLDSMSNVWKNVIVVATGNEGVARHHFKGEIISGEQLEIQFTSQPGIVNLPVILYKSFLDRCEFRIKDSSGNVSGNINLRQDIQEILVGRTEIIVNILQPTPYNENQLITFLFRGIGGAPITENIWTIEIIGLNIVDGTFNVWLPVQEISGKNTQFLLPELNTTLTIPSTAAKVISVGGYNAFNNTISDFSGRGYSLNGQIKPDIVAPAQNVNAPTIGGGYGIFTGTSFAAPHVTGGCALIMEWGIINNNDPFLYGQRIKSFLHLGATRQVNMVYPNTTWGYGTLCIKDTLDLISWYNLGSVFNRIRANIESGIQGSVPAFSTNIASTENFYQMAPENQLYTISGDNISFMTPKEISPVYDEKYYDFIIPFDTTSISRLNELEDVYISSLLYDRYLIAHIPLDIQNKKVIDIKDFGESPSLCGLIDDTSALESSGITETKNQPYLNLDGTGVIVGIIDTGIDYNLDNFKFEDGSSKILYLWDQSIQDGPHPEGFMYGTEYSKEDINLALESDDPYSVVPSQDEIGHGTFLTSIMSAKNNGTGYSGAAPGSEIIAVKLKKAKKNLREYNALYDDSVTAYQSSDVMAGVEYIFRKSVQIGKPVVICIGLGNNNGSHDGFSLFERYLTGVAWTNGVGMIVGVGNEGNKSHHFVANLQGVGDSQIIEFNVSDNNLGFMINIWGHSPDRVSVSLTTPLGGVVKREVFNVNDMRNYEFVLEQTSITIEQIFPKLKNGSQEILIKLKNPTPGLWVLNIRGELILNGSIHGWMPLTPFITNGTNFLQAEVSGTVTIPSTAFSVISVGAYNHIDDSIYVSSGRGPAISKNAPALVAPGVNVYGMYPNGLRGTMTGTSVATAIVSGASALIMQWGIVDQNDRSINSTKLLSYLLLGTRQRQGIIYPSQLWGYGELDLINSFRKIR